MFSRVSEGLNSMSKSSKVYGDGSSVGFRDVGFSDVDSSTDSIKEIKDVGLSYEIMDIYLWICHIPFTSIQIPENNLWRSICLGK